ncbi:MAG: hypothetical protein VYE68_06540 [Acidobacteriota bacterium]|nr:hypothetical protein [Acidobacteriota bacterium]
MSRCITLVWVFILVFLGCRSEVAPRAPSANTTLYAGATLIVGDGRPVIVDAAFVVADAHFTWVGPRQDLPATPGAPLVELDGKTVIPALIDAHQHIGLTNIIDGSHHSDNYTRTNLISHLQRSAYHGVAATMSMGLEADERLAFELRDAVLPNAARFLNTGRGIAATPEAGPQQPYRRGIPRGVDTVAAGRLAVTELDEQSVRLVKIWVDDRGQTVPKLQPEVYQAIIDEAHTRDMHVVAHIGTTSALDDAKALMLAGVDGFAHTVRDRDIDEEYLAIARNHPEIWTIPNLPGSKCVRLETPAEITPLA